MLVQWVRKKWTDRHLPPPNTRLDRSQQQLQVQVQSRSSCGYRGAAAEPAAAGSESCTTGSCCCRHSHSFSSFLDLFSHFGGADTEIWLCLIGLPTPCKEALDFVVATVFVFFSRAESLPIIRIPQLLQVNKGWWLPSTGRFIRKESKDEREMMEVREDWVGGWDSNLYSGFAKCRHLHAAAAAMHSYSSEYDQLTS